MMGTFKTFAIYAGAVICFGGLIFAGIRMMSGRFQDAIPGLFGALFGAGVLGWGAGWIGISTAYGQQKEGSVTLPRNKYVEVRLDKPTNKEEATRAEFKTCKFTTEAIVSEGIDKGEIRKVCTEPTCPCITPRHVRRRSRMTPRRRRRRNGSVVRLRLPTLLASERLPPSPKPFRYV